MRNKAIIAIATMLFSGLFSTSVRSQKQSLCTIGATKFSCPQGFQTLPNVDDKTRLFKSKDEENPLYLFIARPSGNFADSNLKSTLERRFSGSLNSNFQWGIVKNPLTMEVKSQYEYRVAASFGFWAKHLIEMKAFIFSVNGKQIVIGYASDGGEEPKLNQRLFEKGEGLGDTAVGCNAVVTMLNSITREFKEKEQYCTLSSFTIQ